MTGAQIIADTTQRLADLRRFYALMDELARRTGGPYYLAECSGRMDWPSRGVYFFMGPEEIRRESGEGLRIVRVGTHALITGTKTILWKRLYCHKGQKSGGGNHRCSIFRSLVGAALLDGKPASCPNWGQGSSAPPEIREGEHEQETRVSAVIGRMPFLYLAVDDEPHPQSQRGFIERNTIALLSNMGKTPLDAPSRDWLGHRCPPERVQASGLWNQDHVNMAYDPAFLDAFEKLVRMTKSRA